jgi:hypothetical protein
LAKTIPGTTFTGVVPLTPQDLFDTFPPHTGLPLLDVASALLITLPEIDYNFFTSEVATNPIDAIGTPIAADLGILPLALLGAIIPIPI